MSSTTQGQAGGSVNLPDAFGGFGRSADVAKFPEARRKEFASRDEHTASAVATAYAGATAGAASYTDNDLLNSFVVIAVRAPSPLPWVPFVDPASLGLVSPLQEVQQFGEVGCVVQNRPTVIGKTPDPDSATTIFCERSSSALTVELLNVSGDLNSRPKDVAALVDEVFTRVGGP